MAETNTKCFLWNLPVGITEVHLTGLYMGTVSDCDIIDTCAFMVFKDKASMNNALVRNLQLDENRIGIKEVSGMKGKLHIGPFESKSVTIDQIQNTFGKFGKITNWHRPIDSKGNVRKYGVITFEHEESTIMVKKVKEFKVGNDTVKASNLNENSSDSEKWVCVSCNFKTNFHYRIKCFRCNAFRPGTSLQFEICLHTDAF